jgi:hypothetical protein
MRAKPTEAGTFYNLAEPVETLVRECANRRHKPKND